MNRKHTRLAISFLDDYQDRLSNDGCNDWDFPDDWTLEEKQVFVKGYYEWNGDPENYDPDRPVIDNSSACGYVATLIQEEMLMIKENRET